MTPKIRMLIDRSGEAIEQMEPGTFGWTPLEWFMLTTGAEFRSHGALGAKRGEFTIGLRVGHAVQYLSFAASGRAPLAGIIIESTSREGLRKQFNFRGTMVDSISFDNGVGNVRVSYEWSR